MAVGGWLTVDAISRGWQPSMLAHLPIHGLDSESHEPSATSHQPTLLQQQLEAELISLRGRKPSMHEVVQTDEETAGVRAKSCAEDRAGHAADHSSENEWPDGRP